MMTDIGIREIDRDSRAGTKLGLAKRVETEEMLEDVLVANPNMLMRGLTLVGKQVSVATGYVDLLGIDDEGQLTVDEVKREKLTRKAVAQVLDYGRLPCARTRGHAVCMAERLVEVRDHGRAICLARG